MFDSGIRLGTSDDTLDFLGCAAVAELVDAMASGAIARKGVEVRLLSAALGVCVVQPDRCR